MMQRTVRLTLVGSALFAFSHAAVAAEQGLPQFDPTWYASQVFWLAVHFAALYFIAARLILPRIAESLNRREGRIASDLEQADSLQKEATESRSAYERALAEARSTALAVREQTLNAAAAEQAKAEQLLAEELGHRANAANEKIAQASAAVRARMRDVAADASAEIVSKLTGTPADKGAIDAALSRILDSQLREVA